MARARPLIRVPDQILDQRHMQTKPPGPPGRKVSHLTQARPSTSCRGTCLQRGLLSNPPAPQLLCTRGTWFCEYCVQWCVAFLCLHVKETVIGAHDSGPPVSGDRAVPRLLPVCGTGDWPPVGGPAPFTLTLHPAALCELGTEIPTAQGETEAHGS